MQRIPEPELMNDPQQVEAYALADFEQAHSHFISLFQQHFDTFIQPQNTFSVVDLGCGPGDISRRFASAYPACHITAIDAASNMIEYANKLNHAAGLNKRIALDTQPIDQFNTDNLVFDVIISNSLLHHLHEPDMLWRCLHRCADPGTIIWIMDLLRPQDDQTCRDMVSTYAGDEPEILQRDFYHSLRAAFSHEEIKQQLAQQQLDFLQVEQISDRHITIAGVYP